MSALVRAARAAAVLLLAGLLLGAGPGDDPVEARSFTVRYRPLADAAEVVGAILSERGQLTIQKGLKTLIVEDRVSVLDRIPALLASYDLPPRSVEVTISLALGTDTRSAESGRKAPSQSLSREIRGVTETLGDFTKWTAYEQLGSRSVTGTEGSRVVVRLSDEYRVVFEIGSVRDRPGEVTFDSFSLQRIVSDEDGRERYQELQTLGMTLPLGGMHVVGAAKGPESSKALFLFLQARTR